MLSLDSCPNAPAEEIALFDGKTLKGWQTKSGEPPKWVVEEGAMVRKKKGTGDIWTKKRFGDFKLSLEFKTEGNSGVFIRTDDPARNVQTGIEIQVDKPRKPGKHSVGALYDLVAPSKDASKKGEWNTMVVVANGSRISVSINGELVTRMDLDSWTEPQKNPDGSKNKFKTALKDFKREGAHRLSGSRRERGLSQRANRRNRFESARLGSYVGTRNASMEGDLNMQINQFELYGPSDLSLPHPRTGVRV